MLLVMTRWTLNRGHVWPLFLIWGCYLVPIEHLSMHIFTSEAAAGIYFLEMFFCWRKNIAVEDGVWRDMIIKFMLVRVCVHLYACMPPAGIQDGWPADILHQSDANHHEQAALWKGPQQVNFLLAGGHWAHPALAAYWSTLQLGSDFCPPAVEDESQSFC